MIGNLYRPHDPRYAFVVAGVVFLALLAAAGLRSAPGVLIVPWQAAMGWDRATISAAAALGIFLYGLMGPFAAALMQAVGIRLVLLGALALMTGSIFASNFMTHPWQLIASWGVLSGLGSGCVAPVLSATIVNRWFVANRGLVAGLLTASTATGTLIFLPGMAALASAFGWHAVVLAISGLLALMFPLVLFLLPEWPGDIGITAWGADPAVPVTSRAPAVSPLLNALGTLARAIQHTDFWLLFITFFVCGFTTNGLVGTHLISLCSDHGLPEVRAAGLMAMMGVFDLIGTTLSGWLTDRFDGRKLLFVYYGLRGLALIYLPFSDFSIYGLGVFAVFYGLDWIATVPPTLKLANDVFGETAAPIVFGWIAAGHQLGAALAAFIAGVLRTVQGNYVDAFVIAGATSVVAALMALAITGRDSAAVVA